MTCMDEGWEGGGIQNGHWRVARWQRVNTIKGTRRNARNITNRNWRWSPKRATLSLKTPTLQRSQLPTVTIEGLTSVMISFYSSGWEWEYSLLDSMSIVHWNEHPIEVYTFKLLTINSTLIIHCYHFIILWQRNEIMETKNTTASWNTPSIGIVGSERDSVDTEAIHEHGYGKALGATWNGTFQGCKHRYSTRYTHQQGRRRDGTWYILNCWLFIMNKKIKQVGNKQQDRRKRRKLSALGYYTTSTTDRTQLQHARQPLTPDEYYYRWILSGSTMRPRQLVTVPSTLV